MTRASLNATLPLLIRWPAYVGEQILDEERHATKRAIGQIGAGGGLAGMVEPADHHRVERRVDAFDAFDRRLEQLARRHLTRRDEGRLIDRIHPTGLLGQRAHASLCSTSGENRLRRRTGHCWRCVYYSEVI